MKIKCQVPKADEFHNLDRLKKVTPLFLKCYNFQSIICLSQCVFAKFSHPSISANDKGALLLVV